MKLRISTAVLSAGLLLLSCKGQPQPVDEYRGKREQMVRWQIEARGIENKAVLNAMRAVPRHMFVPPELVSRSYGDYPLPIGYGQTISQPYIVAFMTDAVDPNPETRVLEIGTGSGYQAAVLAEICDSVFTIEIVPELGNRAKALLKTLGYKNVLVKIGDGYQGWKEYSPFDAIIVTCAPTHIPAPLVRQLADGGKLIIPVGERENQQLVILAKDGDKLRQQSVLPVRFVPMVDEQQREY
jgi:protein-L-isoaspartate(D-aspartate) O-methyltransferase